LDQLLYYDETLLIRGYFGEVIADLLEDVFPFLLGKVTENFLQNMLTRVVFGQHDEIVIIIQSFFDDLVFLVFSY